MWEIYQTRSRGNVKKQTTPKKTKIKKASLKPVKKKIKSKPLKPVEEEKIETPPKREEEKPKIILNYSAKLGVRSNEGSLITKSLNPPKIQTQDFIFYTVKLLIRKKIIKFLIYTL